ncbi:MAG: hypothetical protein J6R09_05960 [Alistipes sp.]|nr:hypothetical protein [Alistipes sp.]
MSDKSFYTLPFVWNRKVWIVTFGFFAVWVGVSGVLAYEMYKSGYAVGSIVSLVVFVLVMLVTMVVCEGYAPQRLEVGESKIVVVRRFGDVTIARNTIRSITRLQDGALSSAVRTFGVGGLFGFFGRFYARKLGAFDLYATRSENLYLLCLLDGRKIVVSCAEPQVLEEIYSVELK